jgi:predicted RNase H-like HicB family nuclease
MELTFVYQSSIFHSGYIGYVLEIEGAYSEGDTIEELRENLKDAVKSVIEFNKRRHLEKRFREGLGKPENMETINL